MPAHKPHLEFHRLDLASGWGIPPGYPPGVHGCTLFEVHYDDPGEPAAR